MHVEKLEVLIAPGFTENCYIVAEEPQAQHVIVVDPGAEPKKILAAVGERTIDSIVLTHRHYDHIGALPALVGETGAEVIAHRLDADEISHPSAGNLTPRVFQSAPVPVTRIVEEGDRIAVGGAFLTVLHTPGHSIGSICLYDEATPLLIAGDTLFRGAVGRTDLPTGDEAQQRVSLKKLAALPDATVVYPGHDEDTTIEYERRFGYLGFVAPAESRG
ncbi:MAG: MBL fold metallo-hydrolase [Coriobacteriales bacterium]|jgi:glyoxylase-like metal-dependent hydrolase (beta-lactamase superfamily II)|nr:MBL fold metallo-hydrolase [Coriobacteriales bacterium]